MKRIVSGSTALIITLCVSAQAVDLGYEFSGGMNLILETDSRLDDWGDAWTIGGGIALGHLRPVQPVLSVSYSWLGNQGARAFDFGNDGPTTVEPPGIVAPAGTPPLPERTEVASEPRRASVLQVDAAIRTPIKSGGFYAVLPTVGLTRFESERTVRYRVYGDDWTILSSGRFAEEESFTTWHYGFGFGLRERVSDSFAFMIEPRVVWSNEENANMALMQIKLVIQYR